MASPPYRLQVRKLFCWFVQEWHRGSLQRTEQAAEARFADDADC